MKDPNGRALNIGHFTANQPRRRAFQDKILNHLVHKAGGEITQAVIGTYSQLTRMQTQGVEITDALIDYLYDSIAESDTGRHFTLRDGWAELTRELTSKRPTKTTPDRWVYFIRWGDRIKIGTSTDPKARARSLSLTEQAILLTIPGDHTTEHQLHAVFKDLRIDGTEWFHATTDLLTYIEDLRNDAVA